MTLKRVSNVHVKSIASVMSLVFAAGAAQPFESFFHTSGVQYQMPLVTNTIDVDFSKSSASFPSRNFPTWNSPLNNGVEYFNVYNLKDDASGCYELSSTGTTSDDVALFFELPVGAGWRTLSDDHGGNRQFRARIAVMAHEEHNLRISPYSSSYTNAGITFTIKRINADPQIINPSNSASCAISGIPYYRRGFNNDYPYFP